MFARNTVRASVSSVSCPGPFIPLLLFPQPLCLLMCLVSPFYQYAPWCHHVYSPSLSVVAVFSALPTFSFFRSCVLWRDANLCSFIVLFAFLSPRHSFPRAIGFRFYSGFSLLSHSAHSAHYTGSLCSPTPRPSLEASPPRSDPRRPLLSRRSSLRLSPERSRMLRRSRPSSAQSLSVITLLPWRE